MNIISVLLIILAAIWWYMRKLFEYWKRRNIPYLEPKIPYGNLKPIGRRISTSNFLSNVYSKYKNQTPILGLYYFTDPVAVILDMNVAQNILTRDSDKFHSRKERFNTEAETLRAFMSCADTEKWQIVWKRISSAMILQRTKCVTPTVTKLSDDLCKFLNTFAESGEPIEILPILDRYVTDISANIFYGIECNSLENPNTGILLNQEKLNSNKSELLAVLMESYPTLAELANLRPLHYDEVKDFFLKLALDSIEKRANGTHQRRSDFLDLVIQLKRTGTLKGRETDDEGLTSEQIASQIFLFHIATSKCTSTALANAIYLFSMHENIQERTRQEIQESLTKYGGNMTYEAIMDIGYLHGVVDEVLRLTAPAKQLTRITNEEYTIPGTSYVLEKNTKVIIPIWGYHHDVEIFPDPKEFNPDRFTPGEIEKRHPCAYMPFGDGPQECIGVNLVKIVICATLAKILLCYRIRASEQTPLALDYVNSNSANRIVSDFYPEIERI